MSDAPALPAFPGLTGERIALRTFAESDIGPAYLGWLNDPETTRFSNQRFVTHTETSARQYLSSFQSSSNLFVAIAMRDTGQSIGTLTAYRNDHHCTCDMGIMVGDRTMWGGGYGQEAWNLMAEWLLGPSRIRKLTAGTLACNIGMVRIMERAGMTHEASRKAQEIVEGAPQDIVYYAKFAD